MKVHKGDTVLVISGKDKGAKGKVLRGLPDAREGPGPGRQPDQEAHRRSRRTSVARQSGGIVTQEAPIHVSNVMVVDSDGNPTRIGYRFDEETGKKVRVSKKNGKDI